MDRHAGSDLRRKSLQLAPFYIFMRIKTFFSLVLLLGITQLLSARLTHNWSYQEMFDKSDLVVIAMVVSSKDTDERITLPDYSPPLAVVGVVTEFQTCIILKGTKDIKKFQLHHYRYQSEHDESAVANTPELIKTKPGVHQGFLLFLAKESGGRYVPVTGQTDPAILSVLDLRGAAD
jgi:hypothetical protein